MANTETIPTFVEQRKSHRSFFNYAVLVIIGLLTLAGWHLWWFVIACFLPAIMANARAHHNALAITVLNVVMYILSSKVPEGFTIFVIVWIGALVWACLNQRRD